MPRPKPNRLHDELDALLDGRPVELTEELAPLVEAADALRAELATLELDPAVADRHLERVLHGSATVVQLPARPQPGSWDVRRRVVAVALAAALVLVPATLASAAALPGQAMYPFKLAIEQLRIASVQWSPAREAGERTRVADERLGEVEDLVRLEMFNQLPSALASLERAVVAAQVAVKEAASEGEPVSEVVEDLLNKVEADGGEVVLRVAVAAASESVNLSPGTREAIQAAVVDTQDVLRPPPDPVPTRGTPTPTTSPGPGPDPTSASPPQSTNPEPTTSTPAPPTTTTGPPPTEPPPTTEPQTTGSTAEPESAGVGELAGAGELGVSKVAEGVTPTTLSVPSP